MIDIARDYAAIAMGTAQATTTRLAGIGRAGASMISGRGRSAEGAIGVHADGRTDLRDKAERSRELITALLQAELDRLVSMLGLVPESEIQALRQQVQRLERELAELRDNSA